jgi:hypothetical protein
MLQQWARRYQRVAFPRYRPQEKARDGDRLRKQTRYRPQKRARLHAFYRRGVENWHIPRAVEALPLLLHLSLFVFFAGLSVFLHSINRTIFKVVTTWIGACAILYLCLSIFPIIRKDSPYHTPLSGTFSLFLTGIRFLFFKAFPWSFPRLRKGDPEKFYDYFSYSRTRTAEKHAMELNPDMDSESLLWTFESLDDEEDLEDFFGSLPLLCDSKTGTELELEKKFIEPNKKGLQDALIGLIDRTLKPNPFKESVRHRRMIIFTKAMVSTSTSLLNRSDVLRRVLIGDWGELLRCVEFGLSMRSWANNFDKVTVTSFYAHCVAALTISDLLMRKRFANEVQDWIQLVKNMSSPFHPHFIHEHHDDIPLAKAIFIVRLGVQAFAGSEESEWGDIRAVSRKTFRALCELDFTKASEESRLRLEFCDLWNKLVATALTDAKFRHRTIAVTMLKNMRKLYISLHETETGPEPETTFHTAYDWEQVMDNPEFYPQCRNELHRCSSEPAFPVLQFPSPPTHPPTPAQPAATTPRRPRFPEPHYKHSNPSSSQS